MPAKTRTASLTQYGVGVALWTITGAPTAALVQYLESASLGVATATNDGSSVLDLDMALKAGPSVVTLDMSKVCATAAPTVPLMALALGDTPYFSAILRHSRSGDYYINTSPGVFLITSAKLSASGEGPIIESMSATLQGALTATTPASTAAPTVRSDLANTAFAKDLVAIAFGTTGTAASTDDYINFFDSFDIDVSIGLNEGHAVYDPWQWPVQAHRKTTISASRVVESPAIASPAAALDWFNMAKARAAVKCAISLGSQSFACTTANAVITDAKWESGGEGVQKETITLEINTKFDTVPTA